MKRIPTEGILKEYVQTFAEYIHNKQVHEKKIVHATIPPVFHNGQAIGTCHHDMLVMHGAYIPGR